MGTSEALDAGSDSERSGGAGPGWAPGGFERRAGVST